NSQTQMRAYIRELQQLEDLGSKWHAKAMRDETPENAHVCARLNERVCAMRGWSSVNVRLDPYSAQTEQQPSRFEKLHLKHGDDWTPPSDGNGAALAPPAEAPADDRMAVEPNFQILRQYRRSPLLRLEHSHRSALEDHVHRAPRLGKRGLFNVRIGIRWPTYRPRMSLAPTLVGGNRSTNGYEIVAFGG